MGSVVAKADAPISTVDRPPYLRITGAFIAISVVLTLVVALVARTVTRSEPELTGPFWLDGWYQMDSGWYYLIAADGYAYVPGQMSPIAFFPEYPLSVRGLGGLIGDYQVAGTLIAVLAGLATVLLFARWVWPRLSRPAAMTAVAVMMLYPYALYLYGAMYADSLFILTALVAFVLLERRLYWLAGIVGALATAGRPVGVAVAAGLVVRTLEILATTPAAAQLTVTLRGLIAAIPRVRWRQAGVLLSALGLVAWCIYLGVKFGDPLAFLTVQGAPGWNQGSGPITWFKIRFAGAMILGPLDVALRLLPQALMCLFAILLLRRVWRRFGWGYLAYSLVVLAIPIIGTKDFMGTGRYVLAAFPVIAVAGDFLASSNRRWVRPVVLVCLALGLVGATAVYASGVEVS